jgi:hypothetical protein
MAARKALSQVHSQDFKNNHCKLSKIEIARAIDAHDPFPIQFENINYFETCRIDFPNFPKNLLF